MSDIAIKVEHLSKQYRIGERESYKALRDVIADAASSPFRRMRAAFNKNGSSSNGANGSTLSLITEDSSVEIRNPKSEIQNSIWALDDVSFEVKRGEVVGIIGRNGAGKSTLLKILSRITKPTKGHAKIFGRVGSLLEVGTGFHPELTGRENIYLNGAILGMRKAEIERKFDEIVAFAEVEKFIDTPVKRYSSGMYVRLAFAVAAHMETEVLVVDEVLAVGDAQFQKKCLGKMGEVALGGRTVLFVSHNMGAVQQLCNRVLVLHAGVLIRSAATSEGIQTYLSIGNKSVTGTKFNGSLVGRLKFNEVSINNIDEHINVTVAPNSAIKLRVKGETSEEIPSFRTTFSVYRDGVRLVTLHDLKEPANLPKGNFEAFVELPALFLRPGEYSIAIGGYRDGMNEWIWGTDLRFFTVLEEWGENYDPINLGLVNVPYKGERKILGSQ